MIGRRLPRDTHRPPITVGVLVADIAITAGIVTLAHVVFHTWLLQDIFCVLLALPGGFLIGMWNANRRNRGF